VGALVKCGAGVGSDDADGAEYVLLDSTVGEAVGAQESETGLKVGRIGTLFALVGDSVAVNSIPPPLIVATVGAAVKLKTC